MDRARLLLEQAVKRRKRKKKRKKRVPRTSSYSSCCRARRRQRQWHARNAGFPCDDPPRAVFPSSVGLPELPVIVAGMFQKDSGVLIVDSGSGMSQAGSADISSRAVFLSIVAWPMMLGIMAVMDQKDRFALIVFPFVAQRLLPMVLTVLWTIVFPLLHANKVFLSPSCRSCRFHRLHQQFLDKLSCPCGGVSTGAVLGQGYGVYRCCGPDSAHRLEVPQLQLFNKVVFTPVVAQSSSPMVWQTIEILLLYIW